MIVVYLVVYLDLLLELFGGLSFNQLNHYMENLSNSHNFFKSYTPDNLV